MGFKQCSLKHVVGQLGLQGRVAPSTNATCGTHKCSALFVLGNDAASLEGCAVLAAVDAVILRWCCAAAATAVTEGL